MSFKCIAKVKVGQKRATLQGNNLRFPTREDATAFCKMLWDPPHVIQAWKIEETPAPANYCMKNGIPTRLDKNG